MIGRDDLVWKGLEVRFNGHKMAEVVQDAQYPQMFRVRMGDETSDMVNLSRAKDAALGWVIASLNADKRSRVPR